MTPGSTTSGTPRPRITAATWCSCKATARPVATHARSWRGGQLASTAERLGSSDDPIGGQRGPSNAQCLAQADYRDKWAYLADLRDRNSVLFYRLLYEHISEMLSIVSTPTVATVYHAGDSAEHGERGLGFISSASNCFASDIAMEVTTDAVQLFSGAGYTMDVPVERMMRDAKITEIYEGTSQMQQVFMARAILA